MSWHKPIAPAQEQYVFQSGDSGGYNPVDATVFYLNLQFTSPIIADPTTTAPTAGSLSVPTSYSHGRIREVYITIVVLGTIGSTETGSAAILVNNTTATTVLSGGLLWSAAGRVNSASETGLSIPLAPGDFWTIRITPPTWATEPTTTHYAARVVVSYP